MNLPWSGKLGRVANCCIYCGDDGIDFELSSRAVSCVNCVAESGRPKYGEEYANRYVLLAKRWCLDNGVDYEKSQQDHLDSLLIPQSLRVHDN